MMLMMMMMAGLMLMCSRSDRLTHAAADCDDDDIDECVMVLCLLLMVEMTDDHGDDVECGDDDAGDFDNGDGVHELTDPTLTTASLLSFACRAGQQPRPRQSAPSVWLQVAVTPAGLYAGNTFGGYDTAYYLKLMGDRRRRLSYQTKLCPAGQFMKYIKTCAPRLYLAYERPVVLSAEGCRFVAEVLSRKSRAAFAILSDC